MKRFTFYTLCLVLILAGCSKDEAGITVTEVLGIQEGDKEGTALSGVFSTRIKYENDGCAAFPALDVPFKGITEVVNVTVEQNAGAIGFKDIQQPLFGGVYFNNQYEVGSTSSLDRMGDQNILRAVRIKGKFVDPNTFEGSGIARMIGRIEAREVDCTYAFTVSGIRS